MIEQFNYDPNDLYDTKPISQLPNADKIFPKYVEIDRTVLVLTKYRGGFSYYRPLGVWEVDAAMRDGKIIVIPRNEMLSHMKGLELVPTTKEKYLRSNQIEKDNNI